MMAGINEMFERIKEARISLMENLQENEVLCIKSYPNLLTFHKVYKVLKSTPKGYLIQRDDGSKDTMSKERFKSNKDGSR